MSRYLTTCAVLSLVALTASCSDVERARDTVVDTPTAGDFSVQYDEGTRELSLLRRGDPLLVFPPDGISFGAVDAIDDEDSYDPTGLYREVPFFAEPAGLTWLTVESATIATRSADRLEVALSMTRGARAILVIEVGDTARARPGRFRATLTPRGDGPAIAFVKLRPRVDGSEGFYGLGEVFDSVNSRGKVRSMQLVPEPIESSYNDAHVPVPLVIGTRGWGLLVEDLHPAVFAPGVLDPTRLDVVLGTGAASTKGLVFDLLAADHPLDITAHYYDVTGFPRRPARWALGPWIWRNENVDQAQVEADASKLRELDLATTGLWIDRPYATAVQTFDFEAARFPDPHAMIDHLHDLGLRTALWHAPYLDESDPTTESLRAEATAGGYYPPTPGFLLNKWGTPIDVTNPDAVAWWQSKLASYTELGVEGYKLDYGEDVVPGIGSSRTPWKFADGSDERTMHAGFQLGYHAMYASTIPEGSSFLLCRAGRLGDQTHVDVIWPGDLEASFAHRGDKVTTADGDTHVSVGGLPASIIAGLSLGPSGFPLYGSDTGGYRHAPPDRELFLRWFEQTALSTVMQVGTASSDVPWEPTPENGFDASMLDVYRTYARLHLRLFPYVYSLLEQLHVDGRPIARPLGLAFPSLGVHPDDTYMLGDALLVSPVVERGATTKPVPFPPGRWVDWWTGEIIDATSSAGNAGGAGSEGHGNTGGGNDSDVHESAKVLERMAPLDTLPLFQKTGSIVPMLRPTIDAMGPTTDPAHVDSYATSPGRLYVRIAALDPMRSDGTEPSDQTGTGPSDQTGTGPSDQGGTGPSKQTSTTSSFTLFDRTEIAQSRSPNGQNASGGEGGPTSDDELILSLASGDELNEGFELELVGAGAVVTRLEDDAGVIPEQQDEATFTMLERAWRSDAASARIWIRLGRGTHRITLHTPR